MKSASGKDLKISKKDIEYFTTQNDRQEWEKILAQLSDRNLTPASLKQKEKGQEGE